MAEATRSLFPKADLYQAPPNVGELERARPAPSLVITVLARQAARNVVKRQLQDRGIRPHHLKRREISVLAEEYLAQHRAELIAQAVENVQSYPPLLKLYEREQRDRLRLAFSRLSTFAQREKPRFARGFGVRKSGAKVGPGS